MIMQGIMRMIVVHGEDGGSSKTLLKSIIKSMEEQVR